MTVPRCLLPLSFLVAAGILSSCAPAASLSRSSAAPRLQSRPAPCSPQDLVATQYAYGAGAGTESHFIELTNDHAHPCTLGGYPGLAFERAGSQPVQMVPVGGIEREAASSFLNGTRSPTPLRFTIASSGTASFLYEDGIEARGGGTCTAVIPVLTLSGTAPVPDHALPVGGTFQYCGGILQLSPVGPGVTWAIHS